MRTVTCDFERGAYNAACQVFGQNIGVVGCFFHLKQSTFRKAVELGLRQFIIDGSATSDIAIRYYVGMIDAMACIPIPDLHLAVLTLRHPNNIPSPLLIPLFEYFVSTKLNLHIFTFFNLHDKEVMIYLWTEANRDLEAPTFVS